ncbi:hypothetical protein LR48_Vigan06g077100 [Vigna angularis]|uniref:Uncharacterized protein n=1 Tax=Phaseolus angularis TaxID=3914 RepID=A0A0L9URI6_PHAAN|nr:hypothetical protein LR48_Vigan06g077100 [Vigna angularis]
MQQTLTSRGSSRSSFTIPAGSTGCCTAWMVSRCSKENGDDESIQQVLHPLETNTATSIRQEEETRLIPAALEELTALEELRPVVEAAERCPARKHSR